MSRLKINERGTHTSVIEGARDVVKILRGVGVTISPGVIQANVKASGKSVKLKKVNEETFEMVVVVNSSKQTFKVYGADQVMITTQIETLRTNNWNVQQMIDISKSRQG